MRNKYKGYLVISILTAIVSMLIMHFTSKPEQPPRSWSYILIELIARTAIMFVLILFYRRITSLYLKKDDKDA